MYEAKNSKICNFWTFWPVIQLKKHLFKIRQKAFFPNAPSYHNRANLWMFVRQLLCRFWVDLDEISLFRCESGGAPLDSDLVDVKSEVTFECQCTFYN